jgi:hypothetical protein
LAVTCLGAELVAANSGGRGVLKRWLPAAMSSCSGVRRGALVES